MKILVVVGTRPEAIKCFPVIKALQARPGVEVSVCTTGQHRKVLDQVLNLVGISPNFDLNLMERAQTLSGLTCKAISGVTEVLGVLKPDRVVVQGDTTTAFCAGLAAFYQKIPISHIEAGLRTRDLLSPFPEEGNRRLLSVITSQHFAPTLAAAENLHSEGVEAERVLVTGNTVIDAIREIIPLVGDGSGVDDTLREALSRCQGKKVILLTTHRRENWGEGIKQICDLAKLVAARNDSAIFIPVHPNPKVREPVHEILGGKKNIVLLSPLDYLSFVHLMKKSYLILTDSGGVQEEAAAIGCPVFILRDTTERPEGVANGLARLVGVRASDVIRHIDDLLDNPAKRAELAKPSDIYGDGHASARICAALLQEPGKRIGPTQSKMGSIDEALARSTKPRCLTAANSDPSN